MTIDKQLLKKLGKLLDAAHNEAMNRPKDHYLDPDEYRNWCFKLIDKAFWEIENQIVTSRGDAYNLDGTYEEDMKLVYNGYTNRLWLINVMDEINASDEESECNT